MAAEGQTVRVPLLCSYTDFVRVSKAIMQHGRSIEGQEALIRRALNSVIPFGSGLFRFLLGKTGGMTKWCHELNALAASLMFGWLVGDMELRSTEVAAPDGSMRTQRSVVHIKKCRFLDQSGCVSSCVNLCKAPTQAFFTQEAGIPTTLEPDFSDRSCNIVFGQAPLPRADDAAFTEPCFAAACSMPAPDTDGGARVPAGHRAMVLAAELRAVAAQDARAARVGTADEAMAALVALTAARGEQQGETPVVTTVAANKQSSTM